MCTQQMSETNYTSAVLSESSLTTWLMFKAYFIHTGDSNCTDAQADLNVCRVQVSEDIFQCDAHHVLPISSSLPQLVRLETDTNYLTL